MSTDKIVSITEHIEKF